MATFESMDRRMPKIEACLKANGLESLDACNEMLLAKGIDCDKIVRGVQPICFDNAVWAYTLGTAIAVMAVGNAAISMAGNMADQIIENKGIDNFDVGEMVYEGVVGGVMGALGGPGTGTKNLMRQGINSVASTAKTFAREGVKACVKKIGKAAAYYCGQTRYFYDALKRSIPADIMNSIVANTSKEHLNRLLKDIYS